MPQAVPQRTGAVLPQHDSRFVRIRRSPAAAAVPGLRANPREASASRKELHEGDDLPALRTQIDRLAVLCQLDLSRYDNITRPLVRN